MKLKALGGAFLYSDAGSGFKRIPEQVGNVELPEAPVGHGQELPDQGRRALDPIVKRFAAEVLRRTEANGLSATLVVRRCFQWAAGKP